MGQLQNLIITAVVEDTPGTLKADAGDGTDAIRFTTDTKPPKTSVKFIESPEMTGSYSPSKGFVGPDDGSFDITCLLRGSGYWNVAPPVGKLLRACGFVERMPVGGIVAGANTATTGAITVSGPTITDEDDILIEIGTAFEPEHVTSLAAGTTTGTEVLTLTGTTSIAAVNGAEVVIATVAETVTADASPTTTTFTIATAAVAEDDIVLVEVMGSSGNYYETIVQSVVDHTTYQTVTVSPALPAAPTTGDDVVIKVVAEYVLVNSAPSTTVFQVFGATSDLLENDMIMVDISATATPNYEIRRIDAATDSGEGVIVTVSPALTSAPTLNHVVIGQPTYIPTSDSDEVPALSVYHYNDGVKVSQAGCRGNVKFDWKWGELSKAVFSFVPMSWTPVSAEYGVIPDFSALVDPILASGGSFLLNAAEEYVESVSLDMGIPVAKLGVIQTTGYYMTWLSGRKPKGTFNPFATTAAHLTAFKAMTDAALKLKLGSGDNIFYCEMQSILRESVEFADREGINTYNVGFGAYGVEGDDEVILAFCSPTTYTP